jgi:SAM-dependent MidA family methyltransferase
VLQPSKFFSEEAKKDLKVGDTFEICPSAVEFAKDLALLVELTKGAALVIDYGEDHAFSNSFRVSTLNYSDCSEYVRASKITSW